MLTPFLPQNINLAGVTFNLYGVFLGIGLYIVLNTVYEKYKGRLKLVDYLILLLTTFAGARGLYLLHNVFKLLEGTVKPFEFSTGGLALYGALTGLLVGCFFVSQLRKIPLLKLTDTVFINLPLAQAIGRWGNFFNMELYGGPTSLPWALKIPQENRLPGYESYSTFHPVFLYESLLNLVNWFVLQYLSKRKDIKDGTITLLFLVNYGFIRLFTNFFRVDKELLFGLETSDIFSAMFIVLALFVLFIIYADRKYEKVAAGIISFALSAYFTAATPVIIASFVDREQIVPWIPAVSIVLLPSLLLLIFMKFKLINDFDISDREKRPLFMTCLSILYVLFYFWVSSTGSLLLIKISLALVIVSVFFTIISTFWKISGHMTYLLFAITSINYIFLNPMLLYLYLLVPLVAWARVRLHHHTPMQTLIGTATAMIICLSLFYLI